MKSYYYPTYLFCVFYGIWLGRVIADVWSLDIVAPIAIMACIVLGSFYAGVMTVIEEATSFRA